MSNSSIAYSEQKSRFIKKIYQVRLVADLSAAAFKFKLTKELAMWHCLRSLNLTGSGYLFLDEALAGLQDNFNYSSRTMARVLSLGEGVFWARVQTKAGRRIEIKGLKAVCERFKTLLPSLTRFYDVPAQQFRGLRQQRLRMWESLHKPEGMPAHPISRDTLEDYTGVQRRQQKRYDRDSELKRIANFRPGCEQPRLPNSYRHKQFPGHRGMLARVRRELRSSADGGKQLLAEAFNPRRYFDSIRALMRNRNRADFSYVLIGSGRRQIKGRLEWKPVYTLAI